MHLVDLGWNSFFDSHLPALAQAGLTPARVVEEFRGSYRVRSESAESLAEISGKMRTDAQQRRDFPAVGDWVGIGPEEVNERASIACILPRQTTLSRKVVGRAFAEQILATNLSVVFVVSALNREFNLRRIERYLSLVLESGARPVVLLNKADLCSDLPAFNLEAEALGAPVHVLSALAGSGLETIRQYLVRGETAAFIGSSGVGKSTLINALTGTDTLQTQPVRGSDDRGQHTTSTRQMIFLPEGGIVIDTPGMRELQLWDGSTGVAQAFDDIEQFAARCKFRDCGHHGEPGCAVQSAISDGLLQRERLENYRKLQAEDRIQERKTEPLAARQDKEKLKKTHKAMRDYDRFDP